MTAKYGGREFHAIAAVLEVLFLDNIAKPTDGISGKNYLRMNASLELRVQ